MENSNKKFIIYSGLYLIIFFLITPFILYYIRVVDDLGWFFIYFGFINPIFFIFYLLIMKKLVNNSNRYLLTLSISFIVISILILFCLFQLGLKMFSQIRF